MNKKSILIELVTIVFMICACNNTSESTSVTHDSSETIQPLTLRKVRHEICGVESYIAKEHQLCGPKTYKKLSTSNCEVEIFNARKHPNCPGSVTADQYENITTASCRLGGIKTPDECRSGYNSIKIVERKEVCCAGRGCEVEVEHITRLARLCNRDVHLEACRLPEFGAETYKSCRHKNHGVETYNTCERPEFGAVHKNCEFYLLPAEVEQFLTSVKELLPYMGETLISSKAKYFLELDDESSIACHIGKFETDPLFTSQIGELKTLYTVRFGRNYQSTRFDCASTTVPDITKDTCTDSDTTRKCSSVRSYRGAKKWLEVKATDLNNLKNDIAAKKDQAVSKALSDSLDALNHYNK
jgi:hypothetical protein